MTCSLASALAVVGDAWTLLIVKELMLGNRRFEGVQSQTGMSSNSLASRLKGLESEGLVLRRPYNRTPLRYEYRLTDKGAALWPVLASLTQWGDRFMREGEPPLTFGHTTCGGEAAPHLCCSGCGGAIDAYSSTARMSDAMTAARKALAAE